MIIRTKCEICKSVNLEPFYTLHHMPSRLGVKQNSNDIVNLYDMIYTYCTNCTNVQLGSFPSLEEVYKEAHNDEVIGQTWNLHFEKFSQYILNHIDDNSEIFEIGDPKCKTSSLIIESNKKIGRAHV